jgi:hypothetical protein
MLVVLLEGSGYGKTALVQAITAAAASISVTVMAKAVVLKRAPMIKSVHDRNQEEKRVLSVILHYEPPRQTAQMFVDEWWQLPPVRLEDVLSEVTRGGSDGGDSHFEDESNAPGVLQCSSDNRGDRSGNVSIEKVMKMSLTPPVHACNATYIQYYVHSDNDSVEDSHKVCMLTH